MHLLSLIAKNVARRPGRFALTVGGLALAMAAVVSLVGVVRAFEKAMLAMYEETGVDVIVLRKSGVYRSGEGLHQALGEKIRKLPGVREVSPTLNEVISLDRYGLYWVVLEGLPPDSFLVRDEKFVAGRPLRPGDRRAVLLGKSMADNLGKTAGDELEMPDERKYQVVGVFQSSQPMRNSIIVMLLDDLQQMVDRPDTVTAFVIDSAYADKASNERLSRRVRSLAPGLDVQPSREFIDTAVEIRIARGMAWLTSAVALAIGIINMLNAMLMAVHERTPELALLRAIGWRKWSVVRLILLESVVLGVSGAVLGGAAGLLLVTALARLPAVQQVLSVGVAPSVVFEAVAITVLVCLVGGGYPAYRAVRHSPVAGLRRQF